MAHAFKNISAKPTFGTLREELNQSDYINRKKNKCCNNNLPVNKSNLIVGQYTKLNLYNVCTVSNGPPPSMPCDSINDCNICNEDDIVKIDANSQVPFYFYYTIDPLGELFGKTPCGILNYTNYMVFNPPKPI